MSWVECAGCALIAFGPALWVFALCVSDEPILAIIGFGAAFLWLVAHTVAAALWFAVVPLRSDLAFGAFFAVAFQEASRFVVYKLLRLAETSGLRQTADAQTVVNKHLLAFVSGFGFGAMSGLFAFSNTVADLAGPGTIGLKFGNDMFLLTGALTTLCIILLHTFWSVIFFSALDDKNFWRIVWVIFSHYLFTTLTFLNTYELYYISITLNYINLIITMMFAYKSVGGTLLTFKKGFTLDRLF